MSCLFLVDGYVSFPSVRPIDDETNVIGSICYDSKTESWIGLLYANKLLGNKFEGVLWCMRINDWAIYVGAA